MKLIACRKSVGTESIKYRFFVITHTKPKRFFMGAFVGALFTRNTNKTNSKQYVNRGYDSESGTKFIRPR